MVKRNIMIGVRIEEELEALLKKLASQEDRSISWLARHFIIEGLKAKKLIKKSNSQLLNKNDD